ncbi:MAG: hypothetical protein R3338_14270, partial [Thermoanaerobaculia bacterium]|nr:hypothetical protein [Thermoanaerobaculia bacterium]
MSDSSRTRSSRTTPIASTERIQSRLAFGLFTAIVLCATVALPALATVIESVSNRGRNVVKRYTVDGTPSGIALGSDGRLYVGIVDSQSVIVIDPVHDRLTEEVVLDDPRIAATKELVTMRIDEKRSRLVIAQGSDESVTILTLPELKVEREITMEGELIRDAVPDPLGRYLFVLGRDVHIFDTAGESVIRTIREVDPMAIAVSDDGAFLAVVGAEEFTAGRATVVSLWELEGLREVSRDPLQTDREIRAATFAADGQAIMALADDWLGEKPVVSRKESMK